MQHEPSDMFSFLADMIEASGGIPGELSLTDRFTEDLGLDWLTKGSLLTQVGDEWGVKTSCDMAPKLCTVGDVVALVDEHRTAKTSTT